MTFEYASATGAALRHRTELKRSAAREVPLGRWPPRAAVHGFVCARSTTATGTATAMAAHPQARTRRPRQRCEETFREHMAHTARGVYLVGVSIFVGVRFMRVTMHTKVVLLLVVATPSSSHQLYFSRRDRPDYGRIKVSLTGENSCKKQLLLCEHLGWGSFINRHGCFSTRV